MEIRVNVAIVAALGLIWLGVTASQPVAALDPEQTDLAELASMEDELAQAPTDAALARELADTYLEVDRPGLAIAALRAADPTLLDDPTVAHHLARAYEQSGRVLDAAATAEVALARCARSLGTADAPSATPVPQHDCDARQYAMLEMHHGALRHMVRWGVADPSQDHRVRLAYDLAIRKARIASADGR